MGDASLTFCQGETVTVQGSLQYVGGGPFTITNFTIVWVLSLKRGSAALLTKSTTAGTLTIVSGPAGTIQFEITSAQSNALAAGTYWHELHIKAPAPSLHEYCAWHDRCTVQESTIGVI